MLIEFKVAIISAVVWCVVQYIANAVICPYTDGRKPLRLRVKVLGSLSALSAILTVVYGISGVIKL